MLEIQNQEHYNKVMDFAVKSKRKDQLQAKLNYLNTYADPEGKGLTRCTLGYDFALNSFGFVMDKLDDTGAYKYWFNGGLIFHGNHNDKNSWQVHT